MLKPHFFDKIFLLLGEQMKKIQKTSELMWIFGTIFVALGVATCSKTNLGVSMIAAPAFVLYDKLCTIWSGFSVGVIEYIFQGVLLIIMCIITRKLNWRFLFAFLTAIIYGYTLDLFILILGSEPLSSLPLKWIMLIVGDISTAFGVACFFKTYMPLQVYELFVSQCSKTFKKDIHKTKWVFDLSLLLISIALALTLFGVKDITLELLYSSSFHNIGLGTIVTTIINSPIIAFWSFILDKIISPTPLFPKLKNFLEIK